MSNEQEHEFAVGDIVTAKDGNDRKTLWVGIVDSIVPESGHPKVRFWNAVQHKMVGQLLLMQKGSLTFIGRCPDDAEWDV